MTHLKIKKSVLQKPGAIQELLCAAPPSLSLLEVACCGRFELEEWLHGLRLLACKHKGKWLNTRVWREKHRFTSKPLLTFCLPTAKLSFRKTQGRWEPPSSSPFSRFHKACNLPTLGGDWTEHRKNHRSTSFFQRADTLLETGWKHTQ